MMGKQIRRWNAEGGYLEKRCSHCKRWLPLTAEYYHRASKRADGYYHLCKDCKREQARRWRENNPDYHKQWKAAHPERVRELNAAYRERNRIRLREKARLYRALNREAIQERQRRAYRRQAEKYRQRVRSWYWQNPERARARRREYHRQYGDITAEERAAAGELYRADVFLPDGTLARVIGRRGDLWLVRLHDPIKIGRNRYQKVVQVREVFSVPEVVTECEPSQCTERILA